MTAEQVTRLLDIIEKFAIPVSGFICLGIIVIFVVIVSRVALDMIATKRNDKVRSLVRDIKSNIIISAGKQDTVDVDIVYDILSDIEKELMSKADYKLLEKLVYKRGKK